MMRNPRAKFIVVGAIVLAAVVAAWTLISAKPPVSLTVLSYTTNRWSDDLTAQSGSETYVLALIGVTNHSSRSFTYWARGSASFVEYVSLHETPQGWQAPDGFLCGTGLTEQTLPPHYGFTFEAVVDADQRCKVQFEYWDDRRPSRLWQRLPWWLTQRLAWLSPRCQATTEPIDLKRSQR